MKVYGVSRSDRNERNVSVVDGFSFNCYNSYMSNNDSGICSIPNIEELRESMFLPCSSDDPPQLFCNLP